MTSCPNCGETLVEHTSAGRGRYKEYPNLLVCPVCWHKYNLVDGKLERISNTGKKM